MRKQALDAHRSIKIVRAELYRLQLPMIRALRISPGLIDHKETVIVRLVADNGFVGYGESSPLPGNLYTEETAASCLYALQTLIIPRVVGRAFRTPQAFREAYTAAAAGHSIAQTGAEGAFWDLFAQKRGVSLQQLLGGTRREIAVGETVGIGTSLDETMAEVAQRLGEGYVRIKLKIEPGWDAEVLRAARARWPYIDLTADANGAYNFAEHAALLQSFDAFNLSMLEQPFVANDIEGHARLQALIQTPICLDESIASAADLAMAVRLRACKIVNIKPTRVGGLCESLAICNLATAHGIGVWCGGLFETGIGRASNIALASRQEFVYPADMSPASMYFAEDLVEPSFAVKPNGHIDVSTSIGLGYRVCQDRIEKYTAEKIVIT